MQLMALRKKAEGSAPPERKPGRRLTVRRGAALLLVLALAAGAALGGKALFFSGEEQTPLTEQTTYGSLSTTLSGTGTTMPADSVTYTTASEAEITGVYVSAGDTVEVGWTEAGYSFTYRILDQDGLTVAERDAFLQSILKGMQDCLDGLSTESLRDEGKLKQTLQAELDRLGAAAATGQIAYTGGAVEGCWSEAAYDGSGTLVTHDLVMEGMA